MIAQQLGIDPLLDLGKRRYAGGNSPVDVTYVVTISGRGDLRNFSDLAIECEIVEVLVLADPRHLGSPCEWLCLANGQAVFLSGLFKAESLGIRSEIVGFLLEVGQCRPCRLGPYQYMAGLVFRLFDTFIIPGCSFSRQLHDVPPKLRHEWLGDISDIFQAGSGIPEFSYHSALAEPA